MGPGRGRAWPERAVRPTSPPLTVHSPGGARSEGPPLPAPVRACLLLTSSGGTWDNRPSVGSGALTRVCLSLPLSVSTVSTVAFRWPSRVPQSQSGWPMTQGTRSATWTSQRTTSLATKRVLRLCMWRSCPTSKVPLPWPSKSPRSPCFCCHPYWLCHRPVRDAPHGLPAASGWAPGSSAPPFSPPLTPRVPSEAGGPWPCHGALSQSTLSGLSVGFDSVVQDTGPYGCTLRAFNSDVPCHPFGICFFL